MTDIHAASLKGRTVIDKNGANLGTIEDITLDPSDWAIHGLVVNLNRDVADTLHLQRKALSTAQLELSPQRVQALGENVILNVNTDELAGILRQEEASGAP